MSRVRTTKYRLIVSRCTVNVHVGLTKKRKIPNGNARRFGKSSGTTITAISERPVSVLSAAKLSNRLRIYRVCGKNHDSYVAGRCSKLNRVRRLRAPYLSINAIVVNAVLSIEQNYYAFSNSTGATEKYVSSCYV